MERQSKASNPLFNQMKSGVKLKKVSCRRRRKSVKERTFKVTDNEMYLCYSPSKKELHNLRVEIEDIQEVRLGKNTDKFRDISKFPGECCFSIILKGESRIVNLVAPSQKEALLWIKGLKLLKKKSEKIDVRVKQAMLFKEEVANKKNPTELTDNQSGVYSRVLQGFTRPEQTNHQWIKDVFTKADENGDGRLDFKEIMKLVRGMNVKIEDEYAADLFKKADAKRNNTLDEDEFVTFYREITKRPEVDKLFSSYAGEDAFLTVEELQDFMVQEQKRTDVDKTWCAEIIDKCEPKEELRQKKLMTLDGFMFYLLSDEGNLLDPKNRTIYQDMTRPLSHYYISSSHNTYLLEDQLKGPSSVEAYISALQKGCRCVELDVWDGSEEPVIYHGHTLTSKILLRDALASIREYAFVTSQYPLILSFENHCSLEQQKQMADIIEETIGDLLYRLERPEDITELPSPEALKHKILIKGKKLPAFSSTSQGGDVSDEDEAADMEGAEVDEVTKIQIQEKKKKKKTMKLAKEFSDTVYLSSRHFNSISEEMASRKPFEMSSFAESKANDMAKKSGRDFARYNSRFLSRMYPAGWRTNSSNYSPLPLWNVGAQIVALNFQTDGEEMDLNKGRFLENGSCGYVLKPAFMLSEESEPKSKLKPFLLRISIITGQQFPKSSKDITDPYVKVTLYGTDARTEHKTEVIKNNGFNPEWKCRMDFDVLVPELSMVRFEVTDKDVSSKDDLMAQYSIPVTCMQEGYHHILLRSPEGNELASSTLFVHVAKIEKQGNET